MTALGAGIPLDGYSGICCLVLVDYATLIRVKRGMIIADSPPHRLTCIAMARK